METNGHSRPSSANVKAYSFDSQATPQQKAQAMLQEAPALLKTEKRNRASEIVSDVSSNPTLAMPLPGSHGAVTQDHDSKAQALARSSSARTKIGCKENHPKLRAQH